MKPTDKQDRGERDANSDDLGGLVTGFLGFLIRLAALFGVMGAGYAVYTWLGTQWFHVFVFATIAAMLHFELLRIDRHFGGQEDVAEDEDPPNPFRKR